jgi:hypothetical protein
MSDFKVSQWLMGDGSEGRRMRIVPDAELASAEVADVEVSVDYGTDDAEAEAATAAMRLERRDYRRYDVEALDVSLDRWDDRQDGHQSFGRVLDLSAGGVRVLTRRSDVRPDQQVRVRLALPDAGGIRPFVDLSTGRAEPVREWSGWLAVSRVRQVGTAFEVAGRLVDMATADRGMLGLYLSTQPLAA